MTEVFLVGWCENLPYWLVPADIRRLGDQPAGDFALVPTREHD
jgi:hypothetical protein